MTDLQCTEIYCNIRCKRFAVYTELAVYWVRSLQDGYATSSTDTGHTGRTAEFAVGHPEKVTDFAYRAVHEMTAKAKAIMAAHYGRGPRLSYWTGCSTGGRQGLLEAQRYPTDFDGIIVGAPANNQIQLSPSARERARIHSLNLSPAAAPLLSREFERILGSSSRTSMRRPTSVNCFFRRPDWQRVPAGAARR